MWEVGRFKLGLKWLPSLNLNLVYFANKTKGNSFLPSLKLVGPDWLYHTLFPYKVNQFEKFSTFGTEKQQFLIITKPPEPNY